MYEVIDNQIRLVRGDSFYATVEVFDQGEPYTPSQGDVIRFAVKLMYADKEALITKVIPNDTLLLKLEPADTKELPVLTYVYDVEITKENGDVDTFIRGNLTLLNEVI